LDIKLKKKFEKEMPIYPPAPLTTSIAAPVTYAQPVTYA
jgi:hypothetical protein